MVEWKGFATQAALSVIASGLILSGINFFYNEFYNKPSFNIQYVVKDEFVSANITNSGRIPANHLTMVIQSPSIITSYKIFSTDNISSNMTDSRSLKVYIPRFAQGTGSLLTVTTITTKKVDVNDFPKYTFFATFNEGSWKYEIQKPLSFFEIFQLFLKNYGITLIPISLGIILLILLWLNRTRTLITSRIDLLFYGPPLIADEALKPISELMEKMNKNMQEWLIKCRYIVLKDLIRNHHAIEENNFTSQIFSSHLFSNVGDPNYLDQYDSESLRPLNQATDEVESQGVSFWSIIDSYTKILLFNHIPDLVIIDSVYSKIDRRTKLIKEASLTDKDLKILNLECLRLTESALTKIDWKKYTPTFFQKPDIKY
jgi:hypothetical protein